jgi:hypothetical protein
MAMENEATGKTQFEKSISWIDIGSKAVILIYGIGYFIESYYDSRFGVGYLNPLRSRVGFTGMAFAIQVITVILLLRLEEIGSFNSSFWLSSRRKTFGKAKRMFLMAYWATWLSECAGIALLMEFVFATRFQAAVENVAAISNITSLSGNNHFSLVALLSGLGIPIMAGVALFLTTLGRVLALKSKVKQSTGALLTTIGAVCFFILEVRIGDYSFPAFLVWVVILRVAFILFQYDPKLGSSKLQIGVFSLVLLVPIIYAWKIYQVILPAWGGAAKTELTIYFERDVRPFGLTSPVYLLEETEEGYYLLPSDPNSKNKIAVYVPRRDVREVQYKQSIN